MDFETLASKYVNKTYVSQGMASLKARENLFAQLLHHGKLPKEGWDDATITFVLSELSAMDSNNFLSNIGVGEREGRIFSSLVRNRHYGFAHGIGRSGDIAEVQPKAAGSSLLYKLTNKLVSHAFSVAGLTCCKGNCLVVPLATGMSVVLCLQTIRLQRPNAKYVIWSRIDQKSCFKAIITAGYIPIIIQQHVSADGIFSTDMHGIEAAIASHGADAIACVLATTSCFAPRQPDSVDLIAKVCKSFDIPHIINNAYGIQCAHINKLINRAAVIGRVDASK